MQELIEKVIEWGEDRGILENSTPQKQIMKSASELGEVIDCIAKEDVENLKLEIGDFIVTLILFSRLAKIDFNIIQSETNCCILEIISEMHLQFSELFREACIGYKGFSTPLLTDTLYVTSWLCFKYNTTCEECLQLAYNKIRQRKTKMVNGIAVK